MVLLLWAGTWVAYPVVSAIVSFLLARPIAARIKACWRSTPESSMGLLSAIPSSCKSNHPSSLSFPFPASISKGEAETRMLRCDLPQASAFPLSLYFSPALLSRGVWCCPARELQQKPRCSTCMQGESAASPIKEGCWNCWGSYIRLQQPGKVDVRGRWGKSSTGKAHRETHNGSRRGPAR